MNIQTLENEYSIALEAAANAQIEIGVSDWKMILASAAKIETSQLTVHAYDADGLALGWMLASRKYGRSYYRYTAEYPALRERVTETCSALFAARKAAGHFRPQGDDLAVQRRRSRLGDTRPAGTPRGAHFASEAR